MISSPARARRLSRRHLPARRGAWPSWLRRVTTLDRCPLIVDVGQIVLKVAETISWWPLGTSEHAAGEMGPAALMGRPLEAPPDRGDQPRVLMTRRTPGA